MDVQEYSTSQILPKLGLAFQIFIALSLLATEPSIRIYCNKRSKTNRNFKVKNIITIQKLTYIYSLGLLIAALFQGIIMISKYCVSYVMRFNVTFVLNFMLLFILASKDDVKMIPSLKYKKVKNGFKENKVAISRHLMRKINPMSEVSKIEVA